MVNKIIAVIIEVFFPKTHLQTFLKKTSQMAFEHKLTPRLQIKDQMFYPFYYKDPFVKDCILELKERNSHEVAHFFGKILAKWIVRKIDKISEACHPCEGGDPEEGARNGSIHDVTKSSYCPKNILKKDVVCLDPRLRGDDKITFYLVPVPQHISKTKEKGFCHTTTLTKSILTVMQNTYACSNVSIHPCVCKEKKIKKLHDIIGKRKRFNIIQNSMRAYITKGDAKNAYFFIIDDVYTTGATFKEMRRSLSDCGAFPEHLFFISIAH